MDVVQNNAILAPNSGTESEILSKRTYQFAGIWQFYKYGWLMRISEIFLLENLSINFPYHRLTTVVCLNFYSSNLSCFQYFDRKGNTAVFFLILTNILQFCPSVLLTLIFGLVYYLSTARNSPFYIRCYTYGNQCFVLF
jgi:hypothetical protein